MLDQMKVKEQFLNDKVMTVLCKKILHQNFDLPVLHSSSKIIVMFQFFLMQVKCPL